jgi:hypothetical protein
MNVDIVHNAERIILKFEKFLFLLNRTHLRESLQESDFKSKEIDLGLHSKFINYRVELFQRLLNSSNFVSVSIASPLEMLQESSSYPVEWFIQDILEFIEGELNDPVFLGNWEKYSESEKLRWIILRLCWRQSCFNTKHFDSFVKLIKTVDDAQTVCNDFLSNVCVFKSLMKLFYISLGEWGPGFCSTGQERCESMDLYSKDIVPRNNQEKVRFWKSDLQEWFKKVKNLNRSAYLPMLFSENVLTSFDELFHAFLELNDCVKDSTESVKEIWFTQEQETRLKTLLDHFSVKARTFFMLCENVDVVVKSLQYDSYDEFNYNILLDDEKELLKQIFH